MKVDSIKRPDDSFIGEYCLYLICSTSYIYIWFSDKCYWIFITEPWDEAKQDEQDDDEDEDEDEDEEDEEDEDEEDEDEEGGRLKIGVLTHYEREIFINAFFSIHSSCEIQ